jgi:hypothetical protein
MFVFGWIIGVASFIVTLAIPQTIFRRLASRFPWMSQSDGGLKSGANWRVSTRRVLLTSLSILTLVALAIAIFGLGIAIGDYIDS